MSKPIYKYRPRGGVCIASPLIAVPIQGGGSMPIGHAPHVGESRSQREKEAAEHHGAPQVCETCRCLFQPNEWVENEE